MSNMPNGLTRTNPDNSFKLGELLIILVLGVGLTLSITQWFNLRGQLDSCEADLTNTAHELEAQQNNHNTYRQGVIESN